MGRFSKLETKNTQSGAPAQEQAAASRRGRQQKEAGLALGPREQLPYDVPGHIARGDEAFFGGETKQAMRWYSKAMQGDHTHLPAWIHQIRILLLTGQLSEAKVWTTRGLSVFPDAPGLLALRAVNHAKSGQIRQALSSSDRILAERSDDVTAWMARGHILLIAGNKNAEFCFQQCLHVSDSNDWQTPFLLGMILDDERQWSKAIAYYQESLGRRSTLPFAFFRIAQAHARLGRREAARKALAEAEELCGEDDEKLRRRIQTTGAGSIFGWLARLFRRT